MLKPLKTNLLQLYVANAAKTHASRKQHTHICTLNDLAAAAAKESSAYIELQQQQHQQQQQWSWKATFEKCCINSSCECGPRHWADPFHTPNCFAAHTKCRALVKGATKCRRGRGGGAWQLVAYTTCSQTHFSTLKAHGFHGAYPFAPCAHCDTHATRAPMCVCVCVWFSCHFLVCVCVNFRCFSAQRPSTIKYRCNYYYYYFYCIVFCCYYSCCSCNYYCSFFYCCCCCCCCRVLLMKFTWFPTMSKNCAHPACDVTQFLLHLSEVDYRSNCHACGEGKRKG